MGYSFVYVILEDPARRAAVRQFVADRLNAIRAQLPPDANVTLGPNASSMGWIYQYALVDREGDARPARAAAAEREPGQAGAAVGAGRRRSRLGRRAREAVSGEAVSAAAQRARDLARRRCSAPSRARFRRPADAPSRSPTASISCAAASTRDSLDKLEFLVLGRDADGAAGPAEGRRLPAGRLRPAPRHRRSRRHRRGRRRHRHHGAGPERPGRHAGAASRSWTSSGRRCRRASRSSPTYDRSALIWDDADELLPGARLRAARRDPGDRRGAEERPRRRRRRSASCCSARCSPRCRWRRSTRPSTCSRWPGWRSPSARWPTRRSSSSRTAPRELARRRDRRRRPNGCGRSSARPRR